MPKNCLICKKNRDCYNNGEYISFHRFPTDESLRNKWMEALQIVSCKKDDLICSEHFASNSFKKCCGMDQRVRLNSDAIPRLKCYDESTSMANSVLARVSSGPNKEQLSISSEEHDNKSDIIPEWKNNKDPATTTNIISVRGELHATNDNSFKSKSKYRIETLHGSAYLSAKDFTSPQAWKIFQQNRFVEKQAKDAARMRNYRAKNYKQKVRLLIKDLEDQKETAVALYLQGIPTYYKN